MLAVLENLVSLMVPNGTAMSAALPQYVADYASGATRSRATMRVDLVLEIWRLFAEGAFSQAFVPLLAASRATEGDEVTRRLVDALSSVQVVAAEAGASGGEGRREIVGHRPALRGQLTAEEELGGRCGPNLVPPTDPLGSKGRLGKC